MSIKLKFKDFKLDSVKHIKGGQQPVWEATDSTCTAGDQGCCDESHTDDARTCNN